MAASQPQTPAQASPQQQQHVQQQAQQQQQQQQAQQQQQHLQQQQQIQQQQPQVITLQQLQNFLPQQLSTITTADGNQVQVASASTGAPGTQQIKAYMPQPQMQQQIVNLSNLQGIPQQFMQVNNRHNNNIEQ